MAKIDFPKRSGKRSKVSEKSGNFENDIKWQPCFINNQYCRILNKCTSAFCLFVCLI